MADEISGMKLANFLADEIKQWTIAKTAGETYSDEWVEGRIEAYKTVLEELVSGRFDFPEL